MCRDTDSFLELLKPHYGSALNYCRALCAKHDADEAHDVLQQSLLSALENFGSLQDTGKFKSWLFTIITRNFYTARRRSFWKRFIPADDCVQMPDVYNNPQSTEQGIEQKQMIEKALSKISPKERAAILLFELGGFSIEEIAEIQEEKSVSAVKSRLSRTRKKLRGIIEKLEFTNVKKNFKGDIENETLRLAGLGTEE